MKVIYAFLVMGGLIITSNGQAQLIPGNIGKAIQDIELYSHPIDNANISLKISADELVRIVMIQEGWCLVNAANGRGWTLLTNLELFEPLGIQQIRITKPSINIRAEANKNAKVVGKVNTDEIYLVEDSKTDWFKIELDNGSLGWINASMVELIEEKLPPPSHVKVISQSVLRDGPSKKNMIIGKAEPEQVYEVLYESADWFTLKLNGDTAYIEKSVVQAYTPTAIEDLSSEPVSPMVEQPLDAIPPVEVATDKELEKYFTKKTKPNFALPHLNKNEILMYSSAGVGIITGYLAYDAWLKGEEIFDEINGDHTHKRWSEVEKYDQQATAFGILSGISWVTSGYFWFQNRNEKLKNAPIALIPQVSSKKVKVTLRIKY